MLLKDAGVDRVLVLPFKNVSDMGADEFISKYLKGYCGAVVGYDFRFGKNRTGDASTLKRHIGVVKTVRPVVLRGSVVSSTAIKRLLVSGNLKEANRCLGKNYFVLGRVTKGRGVGRTLGYPTANIEVEKYKLLPAGIFASVTEICGKKYGSATYIGSRPTFGGHMKAVEVYIPGFKGNLYGKCLRTEIVAQIRRDKKFSSTEELAGQIKKDLASAEKMLRKINI